MSSDNDIAIRVSNLSKCYQIYEKPNDRPRQYAAAFQSVRQHEVKLAQLPHKECR